MRKQYVQPEIKVIQVCQTDIIATSTQSLSMEEYGTETPDWY